MAKTVIDLFCGAGGLSAGFQQAGFKILAGQDMDTKAGETFARTHSDAIFIDGPIQEVSAETLLLMTRLKPGELDVLIGGPPCQGYSVYNHQRGLHDPRAGLFREYLRMVAGLRPKWLVMENVAGITSIANGAIIDEIKAGMDQLGYRVDMKILKAEDFGVPQTRRRMVIIATRTNESIRFPQPTHGFGLLPYVSVWDAISDLPVIQNGERADGLDYRTTPQNAFQCAMRGDAKSVFNHSAPKLSAINLLRMNHIPEGGSWRDIPIELLPAGMKRAKRSDHTKRYGRPRKDDLSCTILTKCDLHWGAYIHPVQNRSFTVREAARLQSFPDAFVFSGNRTEQFVQVGNAVPPILGTAIAETLLGKNKGAKAKKCKHPMEESKVSLFA